MVKKLLVLTLWLLTFTAALFVLATEVWQGAPLWYFVGATLLGMIGPLGTWAIIKRYPETDPFAWWSFLIVAWLVVLVVLFRLLIPPPPKWPEWENLDRRPASVGCVVVGVKVRLSLLRVLSNNIETVEIVYGSFRSEGVDFFQKMW